MTAGGAGFLLFVLVVGFIASPLISSIAILAMRHRTRLFNRVVWGIASMFLPFSLIILAFVLSDLDVIRNNSLMVMGVMSLFVVALFSPFIVLDFFVRRFPFKKS